MKNHQKNLKTMKTETTFSNNLINSTIFHLLNFEKYTDFQQAARQAAINNNFQIVLFSEEFNVLFSVETRHERTIEEAVFSAFNQNLDRDQKGALVDVGGVSTYWGPITIAGNKYYLMLVDNEKYYTQDEISKLAEIIELSMGMWNYVPDRDPQSEFLRALRKGNVELAHKLAGEIKINSSDIAAVFLISGIRKKEAQKTFAKFAADKKLTTIVNFEQDEICGIAIRAEEEYAASFEDWEKFAERMHKDSGAQKLFCIAGLSSIDDACDAFRLITESEAFVSMVFPYKRAFGRFEMVFVNSAVHLSRGNSAVKKECTDLIKPLLMGRDVKTKQLLETLNAFVLDAGLSANKTAEILDVHANTVQYRLKHIKELLGVDISSTSVLPGLMTALAVARINKEAGPF